MSYQTETNWMDELVSASTGVLHDFVIDIIVQGVPSELRLGFVDLDFKCSTVYPTAWADESLAEAAGQLGEMVEHRNESQHNPGLSSLGTPCITVRFSVRNVSM